MMSAPGFFSRFVGVTELARDTTMFTAANPPNPALSDARNIGSATATREVYALIFAAAAASRTLDTVTIGGVAATIHEDPTSGALICAIASANVPTGTTAVVSCAFSDVVTDFACCVIALDNLDSSIPVDSDFDDDPAATASTDDPVDFIAEGYVMAIAGAAPMTGVSPSAVWSEGGLTEVFDGSVVRGSFRAGVTTAVNPFTTASSGNTIAATFSHSPTLTAIAVVSLK